MNAEPEEIVEARVIAALREALPSVDVIGALSPVPEGEMKLSADTYVSVFADQSGQRVYFDDPASPMDYTLRVVVHFADADDASGTGFRDACRAVRSVLDAFMPCGAFDCGGFRCDAFRLDSTSTGADLASETGGMTKTYNAVLTGCTMQTENQQEG